MSAASGRAPTLRGLPLRPKASDPARASVRRTDQLMPSPRGARPGPRLGLGSRRRCSRTKPPRLLACPSRAETRSSRWVAGQPSTELVGADLTDRHPQPLRMRRRWSQDNQEPEDDLEEQGRARSASPPKREDTPKRASRPNCESEFWAILVRARARDRLLVSQVANPTRPPSQRGWRSCGLGCLSMQPMAGLASEREQGRVLGIGGHARSMGGAPM